MGYKEAVYPPDPKLEQIHSMSSNPNLVSLSLEATTIDNTSPAVTSPNTRKSHGCLKLIHAALIKETLLAWSSDRAIIRPSTEDGPEDTKGIGGLANFTEVVAIHGILIFSTCKFLIHC